MTIKRIIEEKLGDKIFAIAYWTYGDVIRAAGKQGVILTTKELDTVCENDGRWFGKSCIDSGLETLNNWDWEKLKTELKEEEK